MKLIEKEWNEFLGKYAKTYLADDVSQITADFDPDCAEGSMIIVLSAGCTYMKNCCGQWQKVGTTEVIA